MVRRQARQAVRYAVTRAARLRDMMDAVGEPDVDDLNSMFAWLRQRQRSTGGPWLPPYAWGVLWGARSAQALGYERISVLEFGVAGGNGLIALETVAEAAESLLGMTISVYGFGTGSGCPTPDDLRDGPFFFGGGEFPMDEPALRARLARSTLMIGEVKETVHEFLRQAPAPIGFAAFDVPYYTSTLEALAILDADSDRLLPRFCCVFPNVGHPPWSLAIGKGAAVDAFNATHDHRQLAATRLLRYSLPRSEFRLAWPDFVYIAELFDHERYADPQHLPIVDLSLRGGEDDRAG